MTKQDELAQLEARKQAILGGMGQGADYPEEGVNWGQSYGDHMADVTPKQDAQSLAQSRPLDANPYAPHDHDGIMTMSDAPPDQRIARAAPGSQYPEQDSQASKIAALEKRLKAIQGH